MKCRKCGAEVSEGTKFCPECGTKMEDTAAGGKAAGHGGTIQLRCKACGGELTRQDEDAPILICPFCGSKELIRESDSVTIERIRSKNEKEVEMERLRQEEQKRLFEKEKEEKAEAEQRIEKFKKSKLKKWIIAFFIICLLVVIACFQSGRILAGMVALLQTAAFGVAWLSGHQIIPEKFKNMHVAAAAVGFLLIVPFFLVYGDGNTDKNKTFVWPEDGITQMLPEPKVKKGTLSVHEDSMHAYVYRMSAEDYKEYLDACIEKGFNKEAENGGNDYHAFNEEGYELDLFYEERYKRMSIDLDAPKISDSYQWPDSALAKLLPKPKSDTGKVEWEYEDSFLVYVADTSEDEYRDYVKACSDAGFTVDYSKGEQYYRAENADGVSLSLEYKGNNSMSVRLQAPSKAELERRAQAEAEAKAAQEQAEAEAKAAQEQAEAEAKAAQEQAEAEAKAAQEQAEAEAKAAQEQAEAEAKAAQEQAEAEAKAAQEQDEAGTAEGSAELVDGMRPEVKEALDDYEAFMNEYCDFMEKYSTSDDQGSMLGDYTQFMLKYAEAMESIDKVNESDLNDIELAYYIEVTARIEKRLLQVGG